MRFDTVPIGCRFFDPYCGEDFVKISDSQGEKELGGGIADFEPDEEVELYP